MENLEYNAKIAVVKVLTEILHADAIVRESETQYINQVICTFGLNESYQSDLEAMSTLQALSVIRELSAPQKAEVAQMMGKMIVIDEDINYNEVKLYNTFCESCDIQQDFHMEDYPDMSISGLFVNL
ncbi:MAG: hypothetical protein J6T32_05030 [Paludibacteraceae bacterium]|nr:hypothetical protein [Paludibacteraceae bacterium]